MSGSSSPIGFVGVGNMGGAMAGRVLSQGASVVAFDTSSLALAALAAKGAVTAKSPAAVAAQCAIISVVVNSDIQVKEAMLGVEGVLAGAKPGTLIAIHSTIHLATLEAVAAEASRLGMHVVDAAVTGGVEAAERGELAVLIGGDDSSVAAVRPAIAQYASLVLHAGPLGAGMAAKVALMVVSFGKLAVTYEGLNLARAAGVDPVELAKVIVHSEGQSGIGPFFVQARARAMSAVDDPLREIGRHESPKSQKDLHAALELAERLGIELPLARIAHDAMPAVWGVSPGA
jgi:3-hydroxyisobutyrate dehydrogenase-like beta-hydroxyacid dehydrogenase